MSLSINPSYITRETSYDYCDPCSATSCTTDDAVKWTRNYPRVHGDSILGIYGDTYARFSRKNSKCNQCDFCNDNTVSALFYKPARQYTHPTYGMAYIGKDDYYRNPTY